MNAYNMAIDEEQHYAICERIRTVNKPLIHLFEEELNENFLSQKTIKNYISNIDFYINNFLLHFEPRPMEEGCFTLEEFFQFFIHKCMWSMPSSVRSMGASLKKFYKCMLENEKIKKESYDFFIAKIKENISDWAEECDDWNDSIY